MDAGCSLHGYHWEEKDLRFTDENLIGHGSTAEVFRLTLKKFGDTVTVAAKKYKGNTTESNYAREIEYLKQFQHVNYIIQYIGQVKEYNVILLEYASGGSLLDYLHSHDKLSVDQALTWSTHAAQAVQYLHHYGIVHGDIKAPNFLIANDNMLKLCDFGLSVSSESETTDKIGTTRWMAPEVFIDRRVCKESDIYSLSIVFWELHSSEIPFADKMSATHIMWTVGKLHERPPIPDGIVAGMKMLMEQGWESDSRRRPDADEVVTKLQTLVRTPGHP